MADIKTKRMRIEALVLEIVKTLDNKKMLNYERFKFLFNSMDDKEFSK